MFISRSPVAAAVALVAITRAASLHRRATVSSDQLVGFPELVSSDSDSTGQLYLAYQPLLSVANGCVPFPAVDSAGNTNAGLDTGGTTSGDCASSTGQAYVRSAEYNGMTALMYSWYFPKDQTTPYLPLGHRHDWEAAIVWVRDAESTALDNVVAVCPSQHGDWFCEATGGFTLSGSKPLIEYKSVPASNHALFTTTTVGGAQPLVAWKSLPSAAVDALQTTDFADAIVPFNDAKFTGNLEAAKV